MSAHVFDYGVSLVQTRCVLIEARQMGSRRYRRGLAAALLALAATGNDAHTAILMDVASLLTAVHTLATLALDYDG